jgi:hypothetical protein
MNEIEAKSVQWRLAFLRRTRELFDDQLRQAQKLKRFPGFGVGDVRGLVWFRMRSEVCPYCEEPLRLEQVVVGHRWPIARGGRFSFQNLEVICRDCALLRGGLDAQEYREVWGMLHGWARPVRENFLDRLRAGARIVPVRLPPVGSLEWFTGKKKPRLRLVE